MQVVQNWADDEAYLARVPGHAKSCAATNSWENVRLEATELSQPFCSLSAHFLLTFRSRFAHLLLTFRSPFAQDQLDEMVRGLICFGTLYWRHAEGGGNNLVDVFMLLLLPLGAYLLGMDDAQSLGISVLGAIGSSLPNITLYVLGRTLLEMLPRYDSETGVVNADPTITIDTKRRRVQVIEETASRITEATSGGPNQDKKVGWVNHVFAGTSPDRRRSSLPGPELI